MTLEVKTEPEIGPEVSFVGVVEADELFVKGVMLFNFFFRRRTKVVKWVVGIRAVFWPWVLNQEASRLTSLDALWEGLTRKMRRMRSLASLETRPKYSSGKLKSPLKMLALVSSTESSKNGESPLKNGKKMVKSYQMKIWGTMVFWYHIFSELKWKNNSKLNILEKNINSADLIFIHLLEICSWKNKFL